MGGGGHAGCGPGNPGVVHSAGPRAEDREPTGWGDTGPPAAIDPARLGFLAAVQQGELDRWLQPVLG
jgi:hypothetical protein